MTERLSSLAQKAIDEILGLSRYRVDVHECTHFLDVLRFRASEALSQPWRYEVTVTCAASIASSEVMLKPASFTFQTPLFDGSPAVPVRTVYGVVDTFRRISVSGDEITYALRIVPRIALMQHTQRSEVYLNQSVPEVVEQILRAHGLEGADFEFRLSQHYPVRELITQWRETDLEFIQRLLAEVGIFWRFEMDSHIEQDVVIFQDSQMQYQFGVKLPVIPPSRTSDNGQESVWDISPEDRVVTGSVSTRDYNYREALTPQDSSVTVRQEGGSTTGEVYHYAEPFLSEGDADTPEGGAWYTRLRHERYLNGQQTVTGRASSPVLAPGEVLEPQGSIPASLKDGIVITGIQTSGARDKGFQLHFTGIPYSETVCYRPALLKRPVVAGTLPARVESDEKHDTYAYLDNQGRYRVRLDFDRNSTEQGYAYLWLRMAKPYAGDTYGFHSPLLDGTEVSVMFDSGDPDRPYIAHAQHDSEHPDHVTRDNHTRNIWRTAGDNKFRLEDKRQEEHFKLATPYGKTQLNGGHVVDVRREPRGTGFELRTDEYGAVRAGRGMFLTADAQAKGEGQMLDMAPAVNRIKQANREMQALNNAAEAAKALVSDIQAQNNLLMQSIADLQAAVLLASAPQGIAFTSGEHLQLTSTQNTMLTAGKHIDMGAMKNISMSAENELGLFAHKAGVRMIANLGDVEMHSRHNTLDMSAQKELTITSTDDEIVISTPKTLTVNGGGSYLKLSDSGIEHGSKGDLTMKVGEYLVPGSGDDMPFSAPDFNSTEIAEIKRVISKPLSN
ncbi:MULTISPECIES: type VI secretion system Vgr family protein [Erwiniaceae]|jgi:type VI secretion system secreted protein VgrG|uniref:Type VI secretion system tip protein VgrG n=1 Tax=Erwinia persicina TaxID=55211 RepID=A0A4U3EV12_9GAMM|nr:MULTISPECIES: type VI secretion system Vgr family protein [Erwiniaceae]MBD8105839.1 type VI secretion system tip protein VgrG [Erwinia persicina]MBD8142673.1 type VI secretion system tip protein VgrG [Pantoea agglomerans]MBD8209395.1 type VI secretion system tip protein VgrG [Erwinia persicina]MBD8224136.1 type VI secretion system tip protein VgrG [Pantoea agglomerans]TKJ84443.1 type VI secretion system tip protein VgrG [Erwinia persicina]